MACIAGINVFQNSTDIYGIKSFSLAERWRMILPRIHFVPFHMDAVEIARQALIPKADH